MFIIVNYIFYLLNKFSSTIYISPNFRSFGNAAEEIYFGILQANREKKRVFFIYPRKILFFSPKITNASLFKIESNLISSNQCLVGSILGKLLTLYIIFLEFFRFVLLQINAVIQNKYLAQHANDRNYIIPTIGKNQLWNPYWRGKFSWKVVDELKWSEQHLNYHPPNIPNSIIIDSLNYLKNYGFVDNDWFVCIHNTEHLHSPRASDISNYKLAVNFIIQSGGWVFRIGSNSIHKLEVNSARYVDLTEYSNRDTSLDLYLLSKCRYFIGGASGPRMVASLFRRDILGINSTEWMMGLSHNINDIHLLKGVFSKSLKRNLSLIEILNLGFESQAYEESSPHELIYEQNTPSQILDSLLMLSRKCNSETLDQIEDARNSAIRNNITNELLIPWKGLNKTDNVAQKYRIAAMSFAKCKLIYPA